MRRFLLPLAAVLAAVATAPPAAVAQDQEAGCHDYVPADVPEPVTARSLPRIEVRVLVLLAGGLTVEQAAPWMERAAEAYDRVGIDLTVAQYRPFTTKAVDGTEVIEAARAMLGGKRPPWAHLVLTLVNEGHRSGRAHCVGGIRNDEQAFAMADYIPPGTGTGFINAFPDHGARLITHELGHLLGAHHHHSTCVEGLTEGAPIGETAPCSVMWDQVGIGRHFGAVEAAHVRMYAEKFAGPLPPVPAPAAAPGPASAPSDPAPPAPTPPASTPPPASAPPAASSADCRRAKAAVRTARRRLATARGKRRAAARRRLAKARRTVVRRC